MDQAQPAASPESNDHAGGLPSETLAFAHRMFDAARTGDSHLLQAAIDAGLPVNLTNDQGNTLLMLASYAGHTELTQTLLAKGADPNRINDRGQSPLAGAVFKGYDDVVRALVAGGADPRLGTPTAIQTARVFNKTDLLGVLGANDDDMKESVPLPPGPPSTS